LQGGLGLLQGCLVGAPVDHEEQIALLHRLPVHEVDLLEVARHPGPDLDVFDRIEPAGVLILLDDLTDDGFRDGDLRRRPAGRLCEGGSRCRGEADEEREGAYEPAAHRSFGVPWLWRATTASAKLLVREHT